MGTRQSLYMIAINQFTSYVGKAKLCNSKIKLSYVRKRKHFERVFNLNFFFNFAVMCGCCLFWKFCRETQVFRSQSIPFEMLELMFIFHINGNENWINFGWSVLKCVIKSPFHTCVPLTVYISIHTVFTCFVCSRSLSTQCLICHLK